MYISAVKLVVCGSRLKWPLEELHFLALPLLFRFFVTPEFGVD